MRRTEQSYPSAEVEVVVDAGKIRSVLGCCKGGTKRKVTKNGLVISRAKTSPARTKTKTGCKVAECTRSLVRTQTGPEAELMQASSTVPVSPSRVDGGTKLLQIPPIKLYVCTNI